MQQRHEIKEYTPITVNVDLTPTQLSSIASGSTDGIDSSVVTQLAKVTRDSAMSAYTKAVGLSPSDTDISTALVIPVQANGIINSIYTTLNTAVTNGAPTTSVVSYLSGLRYLVNFTSADYYTSPNALSFPKSAIVNNKIVSISSTTLPSSLPASYNSTDFTNLITSIGNILTSFNNIVSNGSNIAYQQTIINSVNNYTADYFTTNNIPASVIGGEATVTPKLRNTNY
jgi:hypothetical protein